MKRSRGGADGRDTAAQATSLGYSHQGQKSSDHAAELPKHPQIALEARTFLVRVTASVSAGQPWCTVKIVTNRG
jgi:hypothetical protein